MAVRISYGGSQSYGKILKYDVWDKLQYYKARDIVNCEPNKAFSYDIQDRPTKPVPSISGKFSFNSRRYKKTPFPSLIHTRSQAELKTSPSPLNSGNERIYPPELQNNKTLEGQVKWLQELLNRRNRDMKSMEEHYSHFIEQLQSELKKSKSEQMEFDKLSNKNKELERLLQQSKMELEKLEKTNSKINDEVISDLKEQIKVLNCEKLELLAIIKSNKEELKKLRLEFFNHFARNRQEIQAPNDQNERIVESQIIKNKADEIGKLLDQKAKQASILDTQESQIKELKLEVRQLHDVIARLKKDNEEKDSKILGLKLKPVIEFDDNTNANNKFTIRELINKQDSRQSHGSHRSHESHGDMNSAIQEPLYFDGSFSPTRSVPYSPTSEKKFMLQDPWLDNRILSPEPKVFQPKAFDSMSRQEDNPHNNHSYRNESNYHLNKYPRNTKEQEPSAKTINRVSSPKLKQQEYGFDYVAREASQNGKNTRYPKVTTAMTKRPEAIGQNYFKISCNDNLSSPEDSPSKTYGRLLTYSMPSVTSITNDYGDTYGNNPERSPKRSRKNTIPVKNWFFPTTEQDELKINPKPVTHIPKTNSNAKFTKTETQSSHQRNYQLKNNVLEFTYAKS